MNYDEALAKIEKMVEKEGYIVYPLTWRSYGWVFNYVPRQLMETGDFANDGLIGGGPFFVSKTGEVHMIHAFHYSPHLFLRNWELSHPDLQLLKCEKPTKLDEMDRFKLERIIKRMYSSLVHGKDKELQITTEFGNVFPVRREQNSGGENQTFQMCNYSFVIIERLRENADIEPREANSNETQYGTIDLKQDEKNLVLHVTATIIEGCEHLNLRIEAA